MLERSLKPNLVSRGETTARWQACALVTVLLETEDLPLSKFVYLVLRPMLMNVAKHLCTLLFESVTSLWSLQVLATELRFRLSQSGFWSLA
ncbi:hypothetical protein Efla_006552 [Eimeria flavescens]